MPSPLQTIVRDLHRPRGRERRGLTLAEGVRLVEEAVAAGFPIQGVVHAPGLRRNPRGEALLARLDQAGVAMEAVTDGELEKLADTQQPQGIIAIVSVPRWSLQDLAVERGPVVVLDAVQDPGNTGTIARTALAFGAAGIVSLPGSVEAGNPKVVRSSMGACFRLPWAVAPQEAFLAWARERGISILAAAVDGEPASGVKVPGPVALVVGNEGAGVSSAIRDAGRVVSIPIAPGAESLNVAVAAGILLYEVTRER